MLMKKSKFTTLLLVFLFYGSVAAQNNELKIEAEDHPQFSETKSCGTPPKTKEQRQYTLEVIDQAGATRNTGTTCVPVRIHIVRENNGSGGISLGDVNIGMSYLNYFYLEAGIEFYICDVNYINNSNWYSFVPDSHEVPMTNAHSVPDAVNVYFVGSIWFQICGYAYYPDVDDVITLTILMANDCTVDAENGTFVHELGHFFDLQHTHDGTENGNDDDDAEHVPRSGGNSNCTTHGDMLCDTEADPNGNNDPNCNFINNGEDSEDIYMNTYTPDLDNIMSYYSDYCGGIFTPGQYTRMENALTVRLGHSSYDLLGCSPNTVSDPSGLTASENDFYGVELNWTDNADNETGYLIERSLDGGTTWTALSGGGVGPDITTFTDNNINANTTYHYRVKASNDDCNHYSSPASIDVGLVHCLPTHESNSCDASGFGLGVAIYNFLLEETSGDTLILNNANGCNGPLSIFSETHSAVVEAGATYDFSVNFQLGTPPFGSYYSQYLTIWVDSNQNGDFTDPGEMLYQSSTHGGPTVSGSITIPANAASGATTLRIRSGWSGGGQISDPCGYHAFGETEDYELVIESLLPVQLTSFTGKKRSEAVELKWTNVSEENNDYFIIERAGNGIDFEYLGQQKGMGTTNNANTYTWLDRKPLNGVNYYRLSQVDFDGTKHIESKIVAIEFFNGSFLSISPNPLKESVISVIYHTALDGDCQISIMDLNGKTIYNFIRVVEKGPNEFSFETPALPNGIYLIRLNHANESHIERFVKAM